ncbi:MAG: carboxypeptidase regulatory-like domain-containing protein [Bacteroidota bacterium]|nr:carboxypeptidase regulatory-like domain-containing protein [Bacteroidota bacterium]
MKCLIISLIITVIFLFNTCKQKPTEVPVVETKISGRVAEKITNNGLSGALITTNPTTSVVTTDGFGNYVISNVSSGQYSVIATKDGYKQNSINVAVKEGYTASADIQLELLLPQLSVSSSNLDFGVGITTLTCILTNTTQIGTINWSIIKSADWLTVNPASGSLTTGTSTLTLTVNRTGLSYGNYNNTLTVTSNGGNKDIAITMTVQNPNLPQLTASPLLLDFGLDKIDLQFNISNTGTGTLNWSAASPQAWISVVPTNDSTRSETDVVTVQVSRAGLTAGNSYAGQVNITSNGGSQSVAIQMRTPTVPTLALSTKQLDFGSTLTNLNFNISNGGSGTLNWQVSSNQNWLTVNPSNGSNQMTVNVYVNRSGLGAGNYSGKLSVTSNGGNDSVNVSMTVPAASNPTSVTLYVPTNITTSSVNLSWSQNNDADFKQYEIHKSTTSSFTPSSGTLYQTIASKSTTSTTVSGLTQNTTYYFKVRVVNNSNLTSDSNERNVTTLSSNSGPYTTDANTIALYHFDETSGNTVADASGNGHTGISNNAAIVVGKWGNARSFNYPRFVIRNFLLMQQTAS